MPAKQKMIYDVTPEFFQWVADLAAYLNMTKVDVLREALEDYASKKKFREMPK